jgi:hypothetical protein
MSSSFKFILATVGASVLLSGPVAASDVEAQLQAMQDRLMQLEDRLESTQGALESANSRIQDQQALIEEAGIGESNSGISEFVDTLEVGGWVAASWLWNTRQSDGRDQNGYLTGAVPAYPFHPDDNSFSVDQLWFELERPITEENRAGFRADLVYGKTAGLLSGDFGAGDGLSGNDFEMYQAYIQYLAPLGDGVEFKFGKFATLLGAEVAQAPYNFNITRGNVYNLFQPITHTGILATGGVGDTTLSLGLVNETRSFPAADIDINNNKAVLWSVGWGNDDSPFGASFNGVWGDSDSGQGMDTYAGDKEVILDFILSYDPTENFSGYINADWISSENSVAGTAGDVEGYGIAAAGRLAINDRTGFSLRGEWADLSPDFGPKTRVWGVTGTLDYKLTEKLMVRGELRYDNGVGGSPTDQLFNRSGSSTLGIPGSGIKTVKDDQLVAAVEAIYTF